MIFCKLEFLLTGCGCSGIKYISELLKKNGIYVNHDFNPIGKMGFVTNAIVNNEVWIYDREKYPTETLKEKILLSDFSNIIHIVRHPILVIPSVITKWKKHNKIWLHIKKGALASEKDKNISMLNAMKYWLYHNKHIMKSWGHEPVLLEPQTFKFHEAMVCPVLQIFSIGLLV